MEEKGWKQAQEASTGRNLGEGEVRGRETSGRAWRMTGHIRAQVRTGKGPWNLGNIGDSWGLGMPTCLLTVKFTELARKI